MFMMRKGSGKAQLLDASMGQREEGVRIWTTYTTHLHVGSHTGVSLFLHSTYQFYL